MAAVEGKGVGESPKWSLFGAVVAAVGASACCLVPLVLLAFGVSGAWIGSLSAMERYRPYWMAAAPVFLALAFLRVYRTPGKEGCAPGSACGSAAGRRSKLIVWIVTALVLGLLGLPYLVSTAYAGE